ncbi:peroxiredoxin [Acidiphilium sp.]|uniref:peroxiredoxin n=1 Tax=Acidiphilium sp. TaxID=527 RepID=UPI003D07A735
MLIITLAAMIAVPTLAAAPPVTMLKPGTQAPDFTLPATLVGHDYTFSLKKALAKGPVVLYFFPAAYTSGCDLEAHTFSTHAPQFTKAGATILGVSENSISMLNKFEVDPNFCAGRFPIASDPSGSIGALYGVKLYPPMNGAMTIHGQTITHGFFARTTFVINAKGKIVASMSSAQNHISPVQHVTGSLTIVQALQSHKAQ